MDNRSGDGSLICFNATKHHMIDTCATCLTSLSGHITCIISLKDTTLL
jgi:hypothetical protein